MYFLFQSVGRYSLKRKKELDAEENDGAEDNNEDVEKEEEEVETGPCRVTRIRRVRQCIETPNSTIQDDQPSTSAYVRSEPSTSGNFESEEASISRDRRNRDSRRRPGSKPRSSSRSKSRSKSRSRSGSRSYSNQRRPGLKPSSKSRSSSSLSHESTKETSKENYKDTCIPRRTRPRGSKSHRRESSSDSSEETGTTVQRALGLNLRRTSNSNFDSLLNTTGCKVS